MTDEVAAASRKMFERYLEKLDMLYDPLYEEYYDQYQDTRMSYANLKWMCETGANPHIVMPIDKSSRWLGFVQGCLAMRGVIDVDEERAYSRTLFQLAYRAQNVDVPTMEFQGLSNDPPKSPN